LNGVVAKRYAAALVDVALEQKNADSIRDGLAAFVDMFFSSGDLRIFLESPAVNPELKQKILATLAARMGLDAAVRNFAFVIVDHRRTHLLREIQQAFEEELNGRLGIAEVEVTSARDLTAAEKQELIVVLERRTGKRIQARFIKDRTLVGGAVVRIGSTIYDGSVRQQLTRLRERLEAE
jgi:F-type H+-transporting ATPase subunit delta